MLPTPQGPRAFRAAWHVNPEALTGLVWLQHGWLRTNDRMADTAARIAATGAAVLTVHLPSNRRDGCSVNRVTDNRHFLTDIAKVLAAGADGPMGDCWRDAVGHRRALPERIVLAGHSAGGETAAFIAGQLCTDTAADRLRGAVLLDPVPSARGKNLRTGLRALCGARPVLGLTAEPGPCNAKNAGERALQQEVAQPVTGFHIAGGRHHDAEGCSSSRPADLACGRRDPANIELLQRLTADWVAGMLSDRIGPDCDTDTLGLSGLTDRGTALAGRLPSPR